MNDGARRAFLHMLRACYKKYIRVPLLDRSIRRVLEAGVAAYARLKGFSFPRNYIRRWKLDMLLFKYEPETVWLCQKIIRPGMIVVDIGAHIGYFTRLFSSLVGAEGAVYAFEADPENFALLLKNTRALRNVSQIERAVSEKKGVVDFYHYDDKSGAHSTLRNVPLDYAKRKISVPATDLDSWMRESGVARIDVIKMDIEGGESAALRGMSEALKRARILITEFAPAWIEAAGSTGEEFLRAILSHGFRINAITQGGLVPLKGAMSAELASLLPRAKSGSHHGEFVNLYCVKAAS